MKWFALLSALLLCSRAAADAPPLRKGDDISRIREVLGPPRGLMETATQGVFFYDRGQVHTRNGQVSVINLISEAEFAEQQAQELALRIEMRLEGERELEDLQQRGGIGHLSGREQLVYWNRFQRKYPDVDVDLLYAEAREQARQEAAEAAEAARISRLEARVLEAELRAARAQEQAALAQQTAASSRTRISYGSSYWGYPVGYVVCPKRSHDPKPVPYNEQRRSLTQQIDILRPRLTGDTTLLSHQIR